MGPIAELKSEIQRWLALAALDQYSAVRMVWHPEWNPLLVGLLPCPVRVAREWKAGVPAAGIYTAKMVRSLVRSQEEYSLVGLWPTAPIQPPVWCIVHPTDFCSGVLSGEITDAEGA